MEREEKENTPKSSDDRLEYNYLSFSWLESPAILRAAGNLGMILQEA